MYLVLFEEGTPALPGILLAQEGICRYRNDLHMAKHPCTVWKEVQKPHREL